MSISLSRRALVAGVAVGLAATALPLASSQAATNTTNGVYRVWVSNKTANSTNKQLTFAFGPSTPGTTVPAGSTWTVDIEAYSVFPREGVNLPTTSRANSYGSWSTPAKVAVDGEVTTMRVTWTNTVPLSSTAVGPILHWANNQNPLRPSTDLVV
ncbi:MAG: hypothetical protein Q4G46_12425, partial [Propionibacteriaceae bacterium]|nr:hypothetical protein [Propionibacteriaceae bacterium]